MWLNPVQPMGSTSLRPHEVHTYLTYAIVHKDVNHAKENALLLMILGPGVERMIGGKTFLLTTIVLVLMGAIASATMARDHWLKRSREKAVPQDPDGPDDPDDPDDA